MKGEEGEREFQLTGCSLSAQVSASSQNAALKLHSAHSSFQKERCHQMAIEVAAYLPCVKRAVAAMKKACPPASAHSPLREVLSEKAEALLRTYNSLKRLGAEMAATGKRKEQKEFQELKEIEKLEKENISRKRAERNASRLDYVSTTEDDLTLELEDDTTNTTESGILTNGIHDLDSSKDIQESSPTSYLPEMMDQFVTSDDSSVVTPPAPYERLLPLGEPFNDVQASLPSSPSESNFDQGEFGISTGESKIGSKCSNGDTGYPTKENSRLPESPEVNSTQELEGNSPSLADAGEAQDHTASLPLMAAPPDEKLVSILAQVEAEWVSNCKSLLKILKNDARHLELSTDADNIGAKVFGILQRFQVN